MFVYGAEVFNLGFIVYFSPRLETSAPYYYQ